MIYQSLLYLSMVLITQTKLPQGLDIQIILADGTKNITVFDGKNLNKKFDIMTSPSRQSCTPSLFIELNQDQSQNQTASIWIQNIGNTTQIINSTEIISSFSKTLIDVKINLTQGYNSIIQPGENTSYSIYQKCDGTRKDYNSTNYWATIKMRFSFNGGAEYLVIQYDFTCDSSYRTYGADWSLVLLVFFSSFLVTALARFGKIYSFKWLIKKDSYTTIYFQGFQLSIWFFILYLTIYGFIALSASIYPDEMKIPAFLVMSALGFLACAFIINELICCLPLHYGLKKSVVFKHVRGCDIISVILSALIIFLYYFTQKVWYMNDLISLCMMGVVVKIFKIQSLKQLDFLNFKRSAVFILIPCALLDAVAAIFAHYEDKQSYDVLVLKYFNYPFEVELPLFELLFNKRCSWISITNIFLPGLVIGYFLRFDRTRNTNIYTVLSFIGLLGGSSIWITVQLVNKHSWPQSIFSYTLMLLLTSIWAYKRCEWQVLWKGTFYDTFLMDPFNQKSCSESLLSSTDEKQQIIIKDKTLGKKKTQFQIDKSLFKGLEYSKVDLGNDSSNQDFQEDENTGAKPFSDQNKVGSGSDLSVQYKGQEGDI